MQIQAQTLTEAEVTAKMNDVFALNNAKKTAEALDAFLLVGRNMEQPRNEVEHQVYVCSQTMTCICYEILKRYEAAYWLAKKLVTGSLTEKEKKQTQGFRGSQRNHQKEASRSIPLGCVCDVGLMEMVTFLPLLSSILR